MSLRDLIRRRIALGGPMPVAEYMALCLGHPGHGYYMTRDPLGAAGDFVTAPEVSQMFGEVLGLALARAWTALGAPAPFCLAEAGPGRGTLMADILRATARVPGFRDALRLHLVETSPALRALQAERLAAARPVWVESLEALPPLPLLLVANEFLDALPVRQFVATPRGWRERVVGLRDGALAFGLADGPVGDPGPASAPDFAPDFGPDFAPDFGPAPPGTLREWSPLREAAAAAIGRHIAERGGFALLVDYGDWEGTGDTLQAVKAHAFADPLAEPGACDLTSHVVFADIARAAGAAGAQVLGFAAQGTVLARLGIAARAAALSESRPDRAGVIARQLTRLTDPSEMGTLFKVLALGSSSLAQATGFQDWE